jgi:hypothetical protein
VEDPIPPVEDVQASDTYSDNSAVAQEAISLSAIGISRWNRSYETTQDDAYVAGLKKSIENDGLMHPVTLVRDSDDRKVPYKAIAGAGRLAAITQIREVDSVLKPGEYRLLDGVTEADTEACTRISVSENEVRRASSVIETARHAQRLMKAEGLKKNKLCELLRIPRETVGKLIDLCAHFDQLPDCWQTDLKAVPGRESDHTPKITRSHWDKISARVNEAKRVTPKLKKAMVRAHKDGLSVAQFVDMLPAKNGSGVGKKPPNTKAPDKKKDRKPAAPPTPASEPKTPEGCIRQAVALLDEAVTLLGSDQHTTKGLIQMAATQVSGLLDALGQEVADATA